MKDREQRRWTVWVMVVICAIAVMAPGVRGADAVYFNLWNLAGQPATNRVCLVIPADVVGNNALVLSDRVRTNSGAAGAFWVSNMVAGTYTLEVQAPPSTTRFDFWVDSTNAVQYARSNLVVTPSTNPSVFYTKAQVDALIAAVPSGTNAVSAAALELDGYEGTAAGFEIDE